MKFKYKTKNYSEYETYATLRIEDYYRRIKVIPGFDVRRVLRLAGWMGHTIHELGAIAGLTLQECSDCIRAGRFTPSASLHFSIMESAFLQSEESRIAAPSVAFSVLKKRGQDDTSTDPSEARNHASQIARAVRGAKHGQPRAGRAN